VHVELAAPGNRSWAGDARLSTGAGTASLRWAVVAVGDLEAYAEESALRAVETWTEADRWFTTLTRS
jgi:hypothetical protein